jgi:branched-chain amino acid transport system substrate-binding protein
MRENARRKRKAAGGIGTLLVLALACLPAAMGAPVVPDAPSPGGLLERSALTRWESFTTRDGLPSDHVLAVRVDGDRVWAGTTEGLAVRANGRWRVYGTADGLPHRVVLSIDVSPRTGDVWVGTMGGLARLSAGRIDAFTQMSSGLSNDFVHAVRCDPDEDVVWAATAMGASRLDLRTKTWTLFTHENTPMHEPWTYSLAIGGGKVFVGAWGGGVLEYTKADGHWREYRDPDGQFEVDLLPDDGPINDVTSGVDHEGDLLWQSTYFGLTRYDGREWRSYTVKDSGLASDFINFVRARDGLAWCATDQGLSVTDGEGWVTYRRGADGRGDILFYDDGSPVAKRRTATALPHNYVLGVDVAGDDVWVATERGVGHGVPGGPPGPGRPAAAPGRTPPVAGMPPLPPPGNTGAPPPGSFAGGRFHYAHVPDALLPFRGTTPYRDLFTERSQFRGAGREDAEPAGLSEVRIGFIGPLEDADLPARPPGVRSGARGDPKAVLGRRMLRAATLALEEANAAGGYRGIPFRLVPRTDLVLWGQSSNELVHFAYDDRVWAVLSSIDSNHNHVLSRATLKLEVPIVSAGSTDPTLVEHAIPWLVRCTIDDRQSSYVLLNEIFERRGLQRPAVLRVNDRDGRTGIIEFVEGARRLGHPVLIEQRFYNGDTDFKAQLARIMEVAPDALVLWGNPDETGRAVKQAREMGVKVSVFGYDRMAQKTFLDAAGPAAEGVTVVATVNTDSLDPAWLRFRDAYRTRWNEEPDSFAAHAYDGAGLILEAIRKGGLNRPRIRDALFAISSWHGATGTIAFDTNMSDIGPPWLATVRDGRFHFEPAPAWPKSAGPARAAAGNRRTGG